MSLPWCPVRLLAAQPDKQIKAPVVMADNTQFINFPCHFTCAFRSSVLKSKTRNKLVIFSRETLRTFYSEGN